MKPRIPSLLTSLVFFATPVASFAAPEPPPAASLTIDAATPVGRVSPMHYGHMTEEINYCYDGGLYAELVRNRAAAPAATNTLAEPVNVVPVVTKLSDLAPTLTHEIAPHSITLLELKAR